MDIILDYYLNNTFHNTLRSTVGANVPWMLEIFSKWAMITISEWRLIIRSVWTMVWLRYSCYWVWCLSIMHLIYKGGPMVKSFKRKSMVKLRPQLWWDHTSTCSICMSPLYVSWLTEAKIKHSPFSTTHLVLCVEHVSVLYGHDV